MRASATVAGVVLGCGLLAGGCDALDPDTQRRRPAGGQPGGAVTVSGSSTVEPIMSLDAERFREAHPGVEITVDGPGTGDGFQLFCQGETDISDASREIAESEAAACERNGIAYVELQIAIDGLSILTNADNDAVECVSFTDLYALVGPESRGFDRWSDANALAGELGDTVAAPYDDVPLDVYGPGEESGTYDSFVEIVLEGLAEERGAEPETRRDYQANADDNVIIQGITGADTSLGWVGYAFAVENAERVKILAVQGAASDGCVVPTDETIADGSYPIARPLYVYVNLERAAANPALVDFVEFVISERGRATVSEVGYVALEPDAQQATLDTWRRALEAEGTSEAGGP